MNKNFRVIEYNKIYPNGWIFVTNFISYLEALYFICIVKSDSELDYDITSLIYNG